MIFHSLLPGFTGASADFAPPNESSQGDEVMRAIRVHEFGGIDTMRLDEIPRPVPEAGEVLVAVKAAGVGLWDRLVREGQSGLGQELPLILGSDISGTVAALGADVGVFAPGDAVYGATNDLFVGGLC
jgi:NADPH:quinone reductase-like Zn-dependent oxidoreductase